MQRATRIHTCTLCGLRSLDTQVQAAVSRAVADLRAMEEGLPQTISLGLVQVNCIKVRGRPRCLTAPVHCLSAPMPI